MTKKIVNIINKFFLYYLVPLCNIQVKITRIDKHINSDIPLPRYMTAGSAGMDLCAAVKNSTIIKPGDIFSIPTGFAISLPEGFEAQIRPRSGLASKYGIGIINSPGTVDSDFRGEIFIPLINLGKNDFTVKRGDRIAQMVINRIYRTKIDIIDILDTTDRGKGGFGHTGV